MKMKLHTVEEILNTYHPIKHDIKLRTDLWPTTTVVMAMKEYAEQFIDLAANYDRLTENCQHPYHSVYSKLEFDKCLKCGKILT